VTSVQTAPTAINLTQLNNLVAALTAAPGTNVYSTDKINNSFKAATGPPTCAIGCCTGGNNIPKVSVFTAEELQAKFNGNITGCGIMIFNGDVDIQGTIDYMGLIIVRGKTTISTDSDTGITGNATVYGSMWTANLNLNVGGSSITRYSSSALAWANAQISSLLSGPVSVLSLVNCNQVSPGTAGCP
jgi:hypothetical protein